MAAPATNSDFDAHVLAVKSGTPRGIKQALPVGIILECLGWPDTQTNQRYFRKVAKYLRDSGVPIVSTRAGYYIAANRGELNVGITNKLRNASASLAEVHRAFDREYTFA